MLILPKLACQRRDRHCTASIIHVDDACDVGCSLILLAYVMMVIAA